MVICLEDARKYNKVSDANCARRSDSAGLECWSCLHPILREHKYSATAFKDVSCERSKITIKTYLRVHIGLTSLSTKYKEIRLICCPEV